MTVLAAELAGRIDRIPQLMRDAVLAIGPSPVV
jgi:hypothetical protein